MWTFDARFPSRLRASRGPSGPGRGVGNRAGVRLLTQLGSPGWTETHQIRSAECPHALGHPVQPRAPGDMKLKRNHRRFHVSVMMLLLAAWGGTVLGQGQTASTATGRASQFASNLVIGYSQVSQWYPSFEQVAGDERWELLWQSEAGVDRWSKPDFDGWRRPIQSACKVRSGDPDRVLLTVSGP